MIDRQWLINAIDFLLYLLTLAVSMYSVGRIFTGIRDKYVPINGRKANREDEPVGYWIVIVSWLIVLYIFFNLFVNGVIRISSADG